MFVAPTYANSPAPSLHIIITSQLFAMPFNTLSCPTYDSHLHTSLAKPRINAALVACPAVPCLDALRFRVSTPCGSMSQCTAAPCLKLSAEGSSLHRSLLHLCITSSLHTQIFPSALCPTQTQSAFFLAVIKETKFHIHAQPSWVRDKKTFVLHVRQDSALNCLFV